MELRIQSFISPESHTHTHSVNAKTLVNFHHNIFCFSTRHKLPLEDRCQKIWAPQPTPVAFLPSSFYSLAVNTTLPFPFCILKIYPAVIATKPRNFTG